MAYFPLISSVFSKGFCTLHNFSPNDWEKVGTSDKSVWSIYSNGDKWITKYLGEIRYGESKTFFYDEILNENKTNQNPIILLQYRKSSLSKKLEFLPLHEFRYNKVPEWRATVGFKLGNSTTSYQGEINPFPKNGSLLTFHPFIQQELTDNYFIFLNLESSPFIRKAVIEIYDSLTKKIIDKIDVLSNHSNTISLNKYDFKEDQLPVFICKNMSGIPFGYGISKDMNMLSLEHTHPPASFVIHGERFLVQKEIKQKWFNSLKS